MSEIWEGVKHFITTKWEYVYLFLVVILGGTAGNIARLKMNQNHFLLKNWLSDVLIGTFTGWAAYVLAQEFKLSGNITAISVGFSAALGLKIFQLATYIFEKKVEDKFGISKDKNNENK